MNEQNRDIETFVELFQARYGLVIAVARRYSPDPESAHDIVQQVFVEFMQSGIRKGWDLQRDINPLLHTITKNVALKFWREKQRRIPEAVRRLSERFLERRDENSTPEDDRIEALLKCLEKLSPKNRSLIERYYFENIPIDELCGRLGVKAGAIHQALCRIRAKLKDCIMRQDS